MIRFLLTLFICINILPTSIFVESSGDECGKTAECKLLKDCPEIYKKFSFLPKKHYCRVDESSVNVCCPVPPQPYVAKKDDEIRIVRECKSYQNIRKKCDKSLIVGGENADPKEFPFMAMIMYVNGIQRSILCGGTLVSKKHVITAAHCFCVENEPNVVRLGELDYTRTNDDADPVDFSIESYKIHEEYNYNTKFHDIAVVLLNETVKFNDYIAPACLPLVDGRNFTQFMACGYGTLKDFGKMATHLQKVKLDNFNDTTCLSRIDTNVSLNTTIQMCAGSFYHEKDTCSGDSGGPLFVDHPDYRCLFLVLGVTSYGEGGCGNKRSAAFYTRVSAHVEWIEKIVWPEDD
ncbi:venom protease-like [Musca autumnalis]|uniref:venom protease-like n=1 Tax=Musca autumnalis TaxID=221902 RepID=UPI003CEE8682